MSEAEHESLQEVMIFTIKQSQLAQVEFLEIDSESESGMQKVTGK